jgi:gas vesicle protein
MRKIFSFMIGTLVGGLFGAMIALLLAPESGQDLRTTLRERGQSFFGEIKQAADNRRIELKDHLENLRSAGD